MNEASVATVPHTRAFSREAVVACLALCALGVGMLVICIATGFEVGIPTSSGTRTVGMGDYAGAFRPERDVTPLVMGVAAAAFAASMLISAGALPRVRGMKLPIWILLAACGATSALGLVILGLSL